MKKQALAVFAIVTLLITLSVGFAYAGTFGSRVRADIPFDFVAGNKTLPSGTYTAELLQGSNVLVIRDQYNPTSVVSHSSTVSEVETEHNSPKFVFSRYGDQYFLKQVWSGTRLDGRELSKSQQEREYLAQGRLGPEIISIVALNR